MHHLNTSQLKNLLSQISSYFFSDDYEAFPAEKARKIVKRIEFRYTPKHGSWLNIAENELSAMTRQCLNKRRIGDIVALQEEVQAWAIAVNDRQKGVEWQFTINDARLKLKSIYPKIKY